MLGGDDTAFAANVAATVGANGGGGAGGSGAAVVIGLPTPSAGTGQMGTQSGDTTPPPVTPGPPPPLSAAPGTAETVGVGLSPSDFGLNPFTLRSGATIGALTPFLVTPGMSVPAAQSGGQTVTTAGTAPSADGSSSSGGWSYDQTTTTAYALNASETTLADGGQSFTETYSFSYDVQTTPTSTGGATVHDWGASGYTFLATNDGGQYAFTLVATLASYETGTQTQTTAPGDGSTNTSTTTWQSSSQYDRTITNVTWASGAASGSDSGGGVATQSSTSTGTYSNPISLGVYGGVGTVSGSQSSYSGQGTSYQFALNLSRDAYGQVSQSGTWTDAGGDYSGDWYSGNGSYTIPPASSSGTPTPPPAVDVTPAPSASGGPYADGAVVTGGGTYTESGADNSSYGYSDQYTLQNNGSWQASSGSGSGFGDGWTQTGYSGSGGYRYAIDGRLGERDVAGGRRLRDHLRHVHDLDAGRQRLGEHRHVVVGRRRGAVGLLLRVGELRHQLRPAPGQRLRQQLGQRQHLRFHERLVQRRRRRRQRLAHPQRLRRPERARRDVHGHGNHHGVGRRQLRLRGQRHGHPGVRRLLAADRAARAGPAAAASRSGAIPPSACTATPWSAVPWPAHGDRAAATTPPTKPTRIIRRAAAATPPTPAARATARPPAKSSPIPDPGAMASPPPGTPTGLSAARRCRARARSRSRVPTTGPPATPRRTR